MILVCVQLMSKVNTYKYLCTAYDMQAAHMQEQRVLHTCYISVL